MKIIFTKHALARMSERKITENEARNVIKKPLKISQDKNRFLAFKLRANKQLLLVHYVLENDKIIVVTVISTSNISKYI